MMTFTTGIILFLSSFIIFVYVGQDISRRVAVVLLIYLGLMLLMSNFQKLPVEVTTIIFGILFGSMVGHIVKSEINKRREKKRPTRGPSSDIQNMHFTHR